MDALHPVVNAADTPALSLPMGFEGITEIPVAGILSTPSRGRAVAAVG